MRSGGLSKTVHFIATILDSMLSRPKEPAQISLLVTLAIPRSPRFADVFWLKYAI